MAIFSDLLSGGLGLLGSKLGADQIQSGADAALAATQPLNVSSPLGNLDTSGGGLSVSLPGELQGAFDQANKLGSSSLSSLGSMNFQERELAELERLQTLRRPEIDRARSQLQSQLLNRGRLGVGVGGGLSGGLFQPESAALEEAILRAQLEDIGSARSFSQGEQSFLLDQASGLFGLGSGIAGGAFDAASLGVSAAAPGGIAALQGASGAATGDTLGGFFSGLGTSLGNADFSGLFDSTSSLLPFGARPNSSGGYFL